MTYQIVKASPRYNSFDAICGWSYRREPNAYETPALPCKLCALDEDANLGDGYQFVVTYGGDLERDRVWNFSKDDETLAAIDTMEKLFEYDLPF